MEKILADTSAWVASFSKTGHEPLKEKMKESIENGSLVIAGIVLLELLQGAKNETDLDILKKRLQILPSLPTPEAIWLTSAKLSLLLRNKGVQASTPDILIAALAIEHDCVLIHCDRDYEHMKKHTSLKTLPFLP